jgi:hypothetical protein
MVHVRQQAIIFVPMRAKFQRSRRIGWAILLLFILGCAGNGRGLPPPAAAQTVPADTGSHPVKNTPGQVLPAKSGPVMRDSTGMATFPEIDKGDNAEISPEIPGIADTNLIDDPSKEWK